MSTDHADDIDKIALDLLVERAKHRYSLGRERFGRTNLDTDKRDFLDESLEEIIDFAWYIAAEIVRLKRIRDRREDGREAASPGNSETNQ